MLFEFSFALFQVEIYDLLIHECLCSARSWFRPSMNRIVLKAFFVYSRYAEITPVSGIVSGAGPSCEMWAELRLAVFILERLDDIIVQIERVEIKALQFL
jgi:hypothetical protein